MIRGLCVVVAVLVALGTTGSAARQQATGDVAGSYLCEGTNPDGMTYRGTVEVTQDGDVWDLHWTFEPMGSAMGIGILHGSVLAVIYQTDAGLVGVAAYTSERQGTTLRLVGRWAMPGFNRVGRETLTRSAPGSRAELTGVRQRV